VATPDQPRAAEIRAWLVDKLAEQLTVPADEIDTHLPFSSFGLSSREAVGLSGDLETWLGRKLSATLLWEQPTVEALAAFLGARETPREASARSPEGALPRDTPVAVIGLACRFPGASDPDAFWQLLVGGVDAIAQVPADRWDADAWYDPDPSAPGKMSTRFGGFVEGIDQFDAPFFGISPREAARMDPQQRLLLETAWEALERAGHAPDELRGSATGVFVGISSSDYSMLQLGDPARIDAYAGTGNAHSIAANRLSYALDLRGPSVALDTACSSSLASVHYACQALRRAECDLALAGGVNAILTPHLTIAFSKAQMMAPDGRCKTFDEAADGYVRGEGCGLVVLKRLDDAQRDGDDVLAVIRGSAVNQDGLTNGLTAPSGSAQKAVIRAALADAAVAPASICYVEAHGTGTPLGDPIEVDALLAVLGEGRELDRTCLLGSVKTNIGHLEAAAGIAGLMKVVLALAKGEIPPHLHLKKLNPRITLAGTPLAIATTRRPWPAARPRRAGVSGFGFGGTNVHVVLEEAPVREVATKAAARRAEILMLSARTETALRRLAGRHAEKLATLPGDILADACRTTRRGRATFGHRLAVVGDSAAELAERLALVATGGEPAAGSRAHVTRKDPSFAPVAFLFTGQGAQHAGMGRHAYETEPVFRQALDRCDALLRPLLERPLGSVLWPEPGSVEAREALIHQTRYTQPALFSLQYALAELWRSWGVVPAAVAGHSVGEYAAACAAGVFTLEDGIHVVAERGRLMQALPQDGEMAAAFAPEAHVAEMVATRSDEVVIAAVNGPEETVISGTRAGVAAVLQALETAGVKTRRLTVSHAFHSPLMDPILDEFERVVAATGRMPPAIGLVSNVTGELAGAELLARADYWRRHTRSPVRFAQAIQTLHRQGIDLFLEIGPASTLLGMGRRCLPDDVGTWIPSLRKGSRDDLQLGQALGALWAHGASVNLAALDGDRPWHRVGLPTYPFDHQRHWIDAPALHTSAPPARASVSVVSWRPASRRAGNGTRAAPRSSLIFLDAGGVGHELARRIEAGGARVTTVTPTACPADAEGMDRLLAGVGQEGCVDLVYLAGLDGCDDPTPGTRATASALWLAQALARRRPALGRLFLVTVGVQSPPWSVAQAPLWGLGRVIALEYPEIWGGLVDLERASAGDMAGVLHAELQAADGEDQVALGGGRRQVARLEPTELPDGPGWQPRADGTYLVTGGLGGIGLCLSGWLVDRGARHLTLLGRTPSRGSARATAVSALAARGVTIHELCADVADQEAMSRAFDEMCDGPPLRGLFHLAGVSDARPLAALDRSLLEVTFSPKVAGAWNLHRLSRSHELECFVLFSSVCSVLGSAMLAHYAAANHFLDTLAHHRRALGLPALAVNWGPWADVGMTSPEERDLLARMGMNALGPAAALDALGRLMSGGITQALVADVDWSTFGPVFESRSRRPIVEAYVRPATVVTSEKPELRSELEGVPLARRIELLRAHIQREVARVLGLGRPETVDLRQGFFDMGLDSLMAVELKRCLEKQLGCRLARTVAFEFPNVDALSGHLATQCVGEAAGPVTESPRRLSEEEAGVQLAQELDRLNY
jgi:acyl transferase domain-containing protein/acyl carrier protein